jgi:hypothetical protein
MLSRASTGSSTSKQPNSLHSPPEILISMRRLPPRTGAEHRNKRKRKNPAKPRTKNPPRPKVHKVLLRPQRATYSRRSPLRSPRDRMKGARRRTAKETKDQNNFDGDFQATKWIKPPPGVHGHRDMQRALYDLLCTMGATTCASIVGGIHPTSPTCGTVNDDAWPNIGRWRGKQMAGKQAG